jgi:hypothetical protein
MSYYTEGLYPSDLSPADALDYDPYAVPAPVATYDLESPIEERGTAGGMLIVLYL